MSDGNIFFHGIHEIVLQPRVNEAEFEKLMLEEILPTTAQHATRVGWVEKQTFLKGFGENREYLWMIYWLQPYGDLTPEGVRHTLEGLYPDKLKSLGADTSLTVYTELRRVPELGQDNR